jgi:hypothetical protein
MLKSSVDLLPTLLPLIKIDGSFMKSTHYNGVCLSAIAKTGEHVNVPIAIAWVPSETTNNFTCFFLNLKAGGVPLQNIATFSDCGKQLNSQKRIFDFSHDWLHLKNCTYHLAKNVCGKFGNNNYALKSLVSQLQSSYTIKQYIDTLIEITKNFILQLLNQPVFLNMLKIQLFNALFICNQSW